MRLKDLEIGKQYTLTDIQFCDDCGLENNTCTILGLMERGMVPGANVTIVSDTLGLYKLNIDSTQIVIRKPEAERFKIEVE